MSNKNYYIWQNKSKNKIKVLDKDEEVNKKGYCYLGSVTEKVYNRINKGIDMYCHVSVSRILRDAFLFSGMIFIVYLKFVLIFHSSETISIGLINKSINEMLKLSTCLSIPISIIMTCFRVYFFTKKVKKVRIKEYFDRLEELRVTYEQG